VIALWVALGAPVLLSVALRVGADTFAAVVPARAAVRLLPLAALACALGTGLAICVLTLFVLARGRPVAEVGRWSTAALPDVWVPWPTALVGAVAVAGLLGLAGRHAARAGWQLWLAAEVCHELGDPVAAGQAGDPSVWTVVRDDRPDAYAVPALGGRIVVSTGMLDALDTRERQVLFAHEASHLRNRHHLWIQAAHIAAAADPLLRGLPAAVGLAAEREADADAVRAVGSAAFVARTLSRAALVRSQRPAAGSCSAPTPIQLAATGSDVVRRVRVLMDPPGLLSSAGAFLALLGITVAVLTSALAGAQLTEHRFEEARVANISATAGIGPTAQSRTARNSGAASGMPAMGVRPERPTLGTGLTAPAR